MCFKQSQRKLLGTLDKEKATGKKPKAKNKQGDTDENKPPKEKNQVQGLHKTGPQGGSVQDKEPRTLSRQDETKRGP